MPRLKSFYGIKPLDRQSGASGLCQLSSFREGISGSTWGFPSLVLHQLCHTFTSLRMLNFGIEESGWFQLYPTPKAAGPPLYPHSRQGIQLFPPSAFPFKELLKFC